MGKPIKIYKIRSMYKDAEKNGIKWAEANDPRITRIGKLIRKTRIDELPQLINVIKGYEFCWTASRKTRICRIV